MPGRVARRPRGNDKSAGRAPLPIFRAAFTATAPYDQRVRAVAVPDRFPRRVMDLLEAKSRIAEALVESIFRRARCRIHPFSAEHLPLRVGREDFSPDFVVGLGSNGGPSLDILVEVKYRPSIEQFVSVENQRGERSMLELARRQWPNLYF